jgi:LPXTG-motif cell wall-anchored protein
MRIVLLTLALGCGAFGALATPAFAQGGPATEEYNLDLPAVTGSGSGDPQEASGSGGDPTSVSTDSTDTDSTYSVPGDSTGGSGGGSGSGSGGSSSGAGSHEGSGPGKSGHDSKPDNGDDLDLAPFASSPEQANTLPAIAADVAGEGGVPLLLAGLAAILGVALFLLYRRRRAHRLEAS